jgi:hypothetical protein
MTALRVRWSVVTSSDLLSDHLLEDRREVLQDLVLDVGQQAPPDLLWSVWHNSASHASASDTSSVSACEVSLVAGVGRGGTRLVACNGMLRTIC